MLYLSASLVCHSMLQYIPLCIFHFWHNQEISWSSGWLQGKSLERSDHVDSERENKVQKERSLERVEEGEVPSTSGSARSPPRSADKRAFPDRSLSPGAQKRHYGSREQYGNRKDGHKDQRHSSHNRDHYHHHSSSHHRYTSPCSCKQPHTSDFTWILICSCQHFHQ